MGTADASEGAEGVEGGRQGSGEQGGLHSVVLEMDSDRDATDPLAPEHSNVTSIDLCITSWKGSFICQTKLSLNLQHRN